MAYTTIILEGCLATEFTAELRGLCNSVHEAIALLECNFPAFRQRILDLHIKGFAYKVKVGNREIGESELPYPTGSQQIVLRPVYAASGNVGKIIAGVALLGLGLTGVGFFATAAGGFAIPASTVALVGGTLALSGFLGLFNSPKTPDATDDETKPSFVMNGAVNTAAQGGIVPVVLGRGKGGNGIFVGSQVASAAFRTKLEVFDPDDIED